MDAPHRRTRRTSIEALEQRRLMDGAAEEMVLIARAAEEGEIGSTVRLGVTLTLHAEISIREAVHIAEVIRSYGFSGATFAPKREGTIAIYNTENLGMSGEQFKNAAKMLVKRMQQDYHSLEHWMQTYFILMPKL